MTHVFKGSSTFAATYQNGVVDKQKSNMAFTSMYISSTSNVWIGGGDGTVRYFDGLIDEVRIFDAAIPTSQIQQMYFAGINKLFAKNQITQTDYQQRIASLRQSVGVGE
jgi:ligand-binding sensor domain-containing protein